MIKKIKERIDQVLWQPAMRNLALTLSVLGIIFLIIGIVLNGSDDEARRWISNLFTSIGGIVLGAGVFSSIMKSLQFSEIFQDALYTVMYDPKRIKTPAELLAGWQAISKSLLANLLPTSCGQAAKAIEATFFNTELDYHFEDYAVKYIIDMSGPMAKIMCTAEMRIVLSPVAEDPKLVHKVDVEKGNNFKLERLVINDEERPIDSVYAPDPLKPSIWVCDLSLRRYEVNEEHRPERTVTMCRTVSWEQDLAAEPYIKSLVTRYVRGFNAFVQVKNGALKPHLLVFEIGKPAPVRMKTPDGFDHWVLAKQEQLILPGQGLIILLLP